MKSEPRKDIGGGVYINHPFKPRGWYLVQASDRCFQLVYEDGKGHYKILAESAVKWPIEAALREAKRS